MGSAHAFASVVNDAVEKHLLEKVGGARLTFPQLSLLLLLARKQSWTISDVATFLRVSNAAASQFVDRLVRHHFLQRHEGTTDRRIAQVSLTERSRRLVAAYDAVKNRRLSQILGEFSAAELEKAAAVLDGFSVAFLKNSATGGQLCLRCGIYPRSQCPLQTFVGPNCFYLPRTSNTVHRKKSQRTERLMGRV